MNDADKAKRDHAQLVRDADRLTEITPQLNILEKLLKERGIQIEYDYPPSALEYVHAKVTMPHGYFADGVNIRFTWELVAIRGQIGRREALICRVEGRRDRKDGRGWHLRSHERRLASTIGKFRIKGKANEK